MTGTAVISEPLAHGTQGSLLDEERQAAQTISGLIARVDDSILWVASRIFAAPHDRRVKRGGCVFLAHLLRFATLVQLSLFPETEVGDVARIAIPNIFKFCRNKANAWPWCYDATLKYLGLLVAAGVLVTRPDEQGIYYLPLDVYALLPEYAEKQIEKLATKRSKVSRSAAFRRTAVHCALPGKQISTNASKIGDSSPFDALDEQEMQRLMQGLDAVIQQRQGVTLLPSTLAEMAQMIAREIPCILKKKGAFLAKPRGQAVQLIEATGGDCPRYRRQIDDSQQAESAICRATADKPGVSIGKKLLSGATAAHQNTFESPRSATNLLVAGKTGDSWPMEDSQQVESAIIDRAARQPSPRSRQNLLSGAPIAYETDQESPRCAMNLPVISKIADSSPDALSDITSITHNFISLSEERISESVVGGESAIQAENCEVADSAGYDGTPEHPLTNTFSHETLLSWRFLQEAGQLEPGETVQSRLAALLSHRYDDNLRRVRHYMKLLGQDHRALDIAIIDGLVRSHFPDPGCRRATLKGGWVTKQYQAYHSGEQVPEDILAWANTPYSYDAIDAILAEAAARQETAGLPRRRVRPEEVIVDSNLLDARSFWANDAGQGLIYAGCICVDLDGDLFSCIEYEWRRMELLATVLECDHGVSDGEMEVELAAYLDWVSPQVCDRQEEAELLANLPDVLRYCLGKLEKVLDTERYMLDVRVSPLSRRRVITVQARKDPRQFWLLPNGYYVNDFIKWYRRSGQINAQQEEEVAGGEIAVDERGSLSLQEELAEQERDGECMKEPEDFRVGRYLVSFDATGATIEREGTKVRYRLNAPTATNVIDFVRLHRDIVRAMTNDTPQELEAFSAEGQRDVGETGKAEQVIEGEEA